MIKYLRRVPLFKQLRFKQLKMLSKEFHYQEKTRGSKLFSQGDKADYVYVVRSGDVRSYIKIF